MSLGSGVKSLILDPDFDNDDLDFRNNGETDRERDRERTRTGFSLRRFLDVLGFVSKDCGDPNNTLFTWTSRFA